MSLNLAIIGKYGQLAQALKRQARAQGHNAAFYDRSDCDLSAAPNIVADFMQTIDRPDAVIIAAAYTAVDAAEEDHETAYAVNGRAPAIVAEVCAQRGIPLVHISTDYVFDGTASTPYCIDSPTKPINVYGASKQAGEDGIFKSNCRAIVLRTSWVFDGISRNFMTTMLRLARERNAVSVVADQIGRPTYVGHLADAAITAARTLQSRTGGGEGIYHVSGTGEPVSWAGFARAIFAVAKDDLPHVMTVKDIPSSDRPTPAARPAYSVLDTGQFEQNFNYTLPTWMDGLTTAYEEWAKINSKSDT